MFITGRGYTNSPSGVVYLERDTVKWSPIIDGILQIHDALGNDLTYYPAQLHFHAPSEHTVNGKHYDLEMHIVHLTEGGAPGAVIGIFFDREAGGPLSNKLLGELQPNLATQVGHTTNGPIDLNDFFSSLNFENYWQYEGSLTTPPCTEGIKWSVISEI
jgi:carbonic anhydrase